VTARPGKPSLRGVAQRIGCSHSWLSEQAHGGTLTAGLSIVRGRVVVHDEDEVVRQWNGRPPVSAPPSPPPPPWVYTWHELRDLAEALDLVARVLVADALERMNPTEAFERFAARMPAAGYGFGDDAEILADAERLLRELIEEAINPLGDVEDDEVAS
jgi:hypothetical protein